MKKHQKHIDWDSLLWNENIEWSRDDFKFLRENSNCQINTIFRNSKFSRNTELVRTNLNQLAEYDIGEYSGIDIKWDEDMIKFAEDKINLNSLSSTIEVSTQYINKSKSKINFDRLSSNTRINWTEEFIETNKSLLNWRNLSTNYSLPWSRSLIEKFQAYWDWEFLSQNSKIDWTLDLLERYDQKLDWYKISHNPHVKFSIDYIKKNKSKINFNGLSRNTKIEWSNKFIEEHEKELLFGNYGLSWNTSLPWSISFINRYINKWSWSGISSNKGIKWDESTLNTFTDQLIWGKDIELNNIDEGHRRNGFNLSNNPSLPWTIELLNLYIEKWGSLYSNYGLFSKVIEDKMNEEEIIQIITNA